jgi:hypothetical protein
MSPASKKSSKKKASTKARANKSQLHRATGLDRATITRRLDDAGVQPKAKKKGAGGGTIYDADQALKVLTAGDRSGITDARLKRLNVAAAREMLKLKKERGDLLEYGEVRDVLQRIFNRLFQTITISYWRDNKRRLHRSKTADALEIAGRADMEKIFNDLRADFRRFL